MDYTCHTSRPNLTEKLKRKFTTIRLTVAYNRGNSISMTCCPPDVWMLLRIELLPDRGVADRTEVVWRELSKMQIWQKSPVQLSPRHGCNS